MKKINLQTVLDEGDENYEKVGAIILRIIKALYEVDHQPLVLQAMLEIRREILNFLLDKQILSNKTVKNLINNQYE